MVDPRDGKTYRTVKIGDQIWMAENLNYDAPGSKFYDNDPQNAEKYGRLYHWATAKNDAPPPGWHLPSDSEWLTLVNFAGGKEVAAAKLKAKDGWHENHNGTDEYGFSALPGGEGLHMNGNSFEGIGRHGYWWTASEDYGASAYERDLQYSDEAAYVWSIYSNKCEEYNEYKTSMFSVRCLQD